MTISIIAALGNNRVIGHKNTLPWRLPADFAHFKKLTLGKPIIMGQKTFESIGKPLQGRKNIVVTFDPNFLPEGVFVAHSLDEALGKAAPDEEVMICGGASIYQQFLPRANKMYLTLIHAEFMGDAYFPEWNQNEWKETKREDYEADLQNPVRYSFITLEKLQKAPS